MTKDERLPRLPTGAGAGGGTVSLPAAVFEPEPARPPPAGSIAGFQNRSPDPVRVLPVGKRVWRDAVFHALLEMRRSR